MLGRRFGRQLESMRKISPCAHLRWPPAPMKAGHGCFSNAGMGWIWTLSSLTIWGIQCQWEPFRLPTRERKWKKRDCFAHHPRLQRFSHWPAVHPVLQREEIDVIMGWRALCFREKGRMLCALDRQAPWRVTCISGRILMNPASCSFPHTEKHCSHYLERLLFVTSHHLLPRWMLDRICFVAHLPPVFKKSYISNPHNLPWLLGSSFSELLRGRPAGYHPQKDP